MQQPTNLKGKEFIKSIPIPTRLKHAKKDKRGYPIPFFIPVDSKGNPDFKYMDPMKQLVCTTQGLCMICGQSLIPHEYWYITGPIGRQNKMASDPAMHEECARYSLAVCPHLHFEKTTRTTGEDEAPTDVIIHAKPPEVYLINAKDYVLFKQKGYVISEFKNIIKEERWHYENGILVQDTTF